MIFVYGFIIFLSGVGVRSLWDSIMDRFIPPTWHEMQVDRRLREATCATRELIEELRILRESSKR